VIDRLKYLYWLYASSLRVCDGQSLLIRFDFPAPVSEFTLAVRCNGGSDAFIFSEVFEHGYYNFQLQQPRTILDAGANIGLTALYFSRVYPGAEIASVEPIPENVTMLRQNILQNDLNVRVFANALSIADTPVQMEYAPKDYGHRVTDCDGCADPATRRLNVPGITVPSLMDCMGWKTIDLLKIDIEGYESTLLGANCEWLEAVRTLCIECHGDFGEAELRAITVRHGFTNLDCVGGVWLATRL
jgi:FkbM family methyltransferase